jgi:hypothetical protein
VSNGAGGRGRGHPHIRRRSRHRRLICIGCAIRGLRCEAASVVRQNGPVSLGLLFGPFYGFGVVGDEGTNGFCRRRRPAATSSLARSITPAPETRDDHKDPVARRVAELFAGPEGSPEPKTKVVALFLPLNSVWSLAPGCRG